MEDIFFKEKTLTSIVVSTIPFLSLGKDGRNKGKGIES